MNEERIKQLLSEAKRIYNNPLPESYNNFIQWVNSFNGDDDGKIIKEMYHFIAKKNNNPGTLIFTIDDFYEKEILKYLSNNLRQQF